MCVTCDTVGDIYRTGAADAAVSHNVLQRRGAGFTRLLTLVCLRTAVSAARLRVGSSWHRGRG